MREPAWIITEDHINPKEPTKRLTASYQVDTYPVKFRLFDDDGILYYEGRARTQDDVIQAHDWGMGYAGTTRSMISQDSPFQPFIG